MLALPPHYALSIGYTRTLDAFALEMVFSSPLVPSPTLSSSTKTPPLGSSSIASPALSKSSFATAPGTESIGLGVSGAGDLGLGAVNNGGTTTSTSLLEDGAKAEVTSPLELTQFVSRTDGTRATIELCRKSLTSVPLRASQVDTLLNDLEARFDSLSSDVLSRRALATRPLSRPFRSH